jgi:hypothetical protein
MDEEELLQDEEYVDLVVDMIEGQDEEDDRSDVDDELALLKELGF